jgi:prophage regulatory protein
MEQAEQPKAELSELEELVLPKELHKYGGPKRSALRDQIAKGQFPRPIRLSARRVAWLKIELIKWQSSKIAERDRAGD